MRGRYAPEFRDVKKRAKHYHCRCPTHAELQSKIFKAANNPVERKQWTDKLQAHHFEVRHWRKLETSLQLRAKSNPEEVVVLSYDDTSALGFPRMTVYS